MIEVGQPFPPFELSDESGILWANKDLLGAASIIYFYPKDDTPGCTLEAKEFRDRISQFEGIRVIGVSPDDRKSHQKFIRKHELPFTLLSDSSHALAEACGIWVEKSLYGRKYMGVERTTFLIDAAGIVQEVWRKVAPEGHAEAVRQACGVR